MSNMIQAARQQVDQLTRAAYERAAAAGLLPAGAEVKATIEIPKDAAHGDYASSYAMAGAKALRMAPRAIAQTIVDHLDLEGSYFQKVEIAGPGFLNFTLGPKWYKEVLADVEREGAQYGELILTNYDPRPFLRRQMSLFDSPAGDSGMELVHIPESPLKIIA